MKIFEIDLFWLTLAPTYYGLMYVLGFLYGIWAIKRTWKYSQVQRENLFLYIFIWVVLWWRLGYILFYNLSAYLASPLDIFKIWEGWMSFHGWMLWVWVALLLFSRRYKLSFLSLWDDIAKIVPVWLFLGRIWNYLNKELLWFPYNGPLAVYTPHGSYFPSPLLEALLEWLVIFVILNFMIKKTAFPGQLASLFIILYWIFRTLIELFVRTPDIHIWYYFWFLTQGSILSIVMILIWSAWYIYLWKNK